MTTQTNSAYTQVNVSCSNCGNTFETKSTHNGDLRVETCSNCHSAYTGEQRTLTNNGQIDKFKQRYADKKQ